MNMRSIELKDHVVPSKALVVLSPDLVEPTDPAGSILVQRALQLARTTGCELEFFHVCHDATLDWSFLNSEADVDRARNQLLQRDTTMISEFMARLPAEGLQVSADVRWDDPRTDAIITKAAESEADLIIKQARDHKFVLGLWNTVDWALIRQAPVPVWFVKAGSGEYSDTLDNIKRVCAAVGTSSDNGKVLAGVDHAVVTMAKSVAKSLTARPMMAHTYTVPRKLPTYVSYAPAFGETPAHNTGHVQAQAQARVGAKHRQHIHAFADYHDLEDGDVVVREGHPKHVLPHLCEQYGVDLLVMGAQNRSYWNKLWASVAAEPVLSSAQCDVLFVRQVDPEAAPDIAAVAQQRRYVTGEPAYDLQRAVLSPADVFATPLELLKAQHISESMKRRILRAWRDDMNALLADQTDGGANNEPVLRMLDAVNDCLVLLEDVQDRTLALA